MSEQQSEIDAARVKVRRALEAADNGNHAGERAVLSMVEMTGAELFRRLEKGMLVFLDGRNEHGSHVLSSPIAHTIDDASSALEEQAEEILRCAEALGFQIGSHVWARFSWIREEYHHGYWEFSEIDEGVTRLYHATFPGSDGNDPTVPSPTPVLA